MAPSVLGTLRLTLGFLRAHALALVRLAWFPVLVLSLADVFIASRLLPLRGAIQSGDAAAIEKLLMPELGYVALFLAASLATTAAAVTAVLRFVALGEGQGSGGLMYVPPGKPVLRVLGVAFLLGLLSFAVLMVLALVLGLVAANVPAIAPIMSPLMAIALAVVVTRWLLAFPIAAVEGRIDLAAAWALAKPIYRQFLSMVLAIMATIMLLDFAIAWALAPHGAINAQDAGKAMAGRWPIATLAQFAANLISILGLFTLVGVVHRLRTSGLKPPFGGTLVRPESKSDEKAS